MQMYVEYITIVIVRKSQLIKSSNADAHMCKTGADEFRLFQTAFELFCRSEESYQRHHFLFLAATLCFPYNVHPLCSDSHCSITRTIGERRWNIAQLPFELAPAHDLMLNRFVTAERSNSKSDICQRRREWELKGRTRNCITMQEFLILCAVATGLYRITFAFFFSRFLGAGVSPHERASGSSGAGVSGKPPGVSLTVGCVGGAHSRFWWTTARSRSRGGTDTAYIRISLLARCTCESPTLFVNCTWIVLKFSHAYHLQKLWAHYLLS